MHTPMSSSVHTSMSSQFDTPVNSSTKNESLSPEISDTSSKPRKFRFLNDNYDETEEIEIDNELLMLSIKEPSSYSQDAKEKEWRNAMKIELSSIEKNNTWVLTDLP